ncbi:hypothetical protein QJS04_geneDACA015728 [Acorus gramineus]|uniref:Secreted protein n=1 Tax=Acorus gramineus TaxID=55184 RepID=A0AAV9BP94_ACOGR|nr:hypothetical protein QJS04_geneDACA015728 [Acorus gramineus]
MARRCREGWGRRVLSRSRSKGVCWLVALMGVGGRDDDLILPRRGDAVHHTFASDPSWMLRWSGGREGIASDVRGPVLNGRTVHGRAGLVLHRRMVQASL